MAPSRKFASLRGRPNPDLQARHIPSACADDAALQLIAFRYEETVQAEPPIPIPPPRNPLRVNRSPPRPSTAIPTTSTSAPLGGASSKPTTTPSRPRASTRHVIVPPPLATPDEHPALRVQRHSHGSSQHSPSSSSTTYTDWKRDSALGTISSASTTLPDEIEIEQGDASDFQEDACAKLDSEDAPSSIYSTDPDGPTLPLAPSTGSRSLYHVPRHSCQSRWSLTESDISQTDSTRGRNSTRRLIRGLSIKLAPPMRRLKKEGHQSHQSHQSPGQAASEAMRMATLAMAPISVPRSPQAPQSHHSRQAQPQGSPAPPFASSPNLRDPHGHEIGQSDSQSPNPSNPAPLSEDPQQTTPPSDSAPTINTNIPQGSLLDEGFLDSFEFSKRGSVYFGGKRAIGAPSPAVVASLMDKFTDPRAAPATPGSPPHGATAFKPATSAAKPDWRHHAKKSSLPDIRVMPDDTERESQKVRSLYESTDPVYWQDVAPGRQSGEPLEPPQEVPSDGADNIASHGSREAPKSVRTMYLSPTSPISAISLPSPRGNTRRNKFELAGGIEDWEDVQGEDVDRYGFITVGSGRPASRASVPAESRSLYTSTGRRNGRNVLVKRHHGPPLSQGLSRIPSRKISARSLNTQASALSASSRMSVRSGIRIAANMLPHNRDRRIIDAAGDMLSLPPGLADTDEQQKSVQAIKAAQDKEARRAEKWRKMAKIVTKGKDRQGIRFMANNIKKDLGIKFSTEHLAKMAGKDGVGENKHFEIQGVDIEFDNTNPKLIERTWKGIPDRWRSSAWYSFLSSSARSANSEVTEEHLIAEFHRLQDCSSPDDVQIDLDVPRTINRHIMFRTRYRGGQRLLFRVLHALSLYFPDTGYVQGMAALAASLLCYYDEERCFVMLVRLWQFRGLERLYEQGFAGLMLALQDLEQHWLCGKPIAKKLNDLGVDPTAYGTRWYLTLFNLSIPFPVQLRVWDVFMLLGGPPSTPPSIPGKAKDKAASTETDPNSDLTFDGLDILHATAAALIDMHKDVIIGGDFENVMKGLTSFQDVKDEDKFLVLVRAEWNMHRGKKKG